jgi:hypothetical protein
MTSKDLSDGSPGQGGADRAKLQGYRCPGCDQEFYVGGNEEAYACPVCKSETIWEMTGPFQLALSSPDAPEQAEPRLTLNEVLAVWYAWKRGLHESAFNHPEGNRFVIALDERFRAASSPSPARVGALAELLKEHDKAFALLKSLSQECKGDCDDHRWTRCRACLANEELEHKGVKSMVREFLAALASLQEPAK